MSTVQITDRMLTMSDGVRLFTRTVLPGDGTGRYPVVLMRTPYDPEVTVSEETVRRWEENAFLKRGFAAVVQHCRGRNGSEGDCIPYSEEERRDGLETLDWIRRQPFYGGEIYLNGGSYTASVLMLCLDEPIPDLKAICFSVQTESMYHRNYWNGLCRTFCGFEWWLSMISDQRPKIADDREIYRRPYRDIMKRATGRELPAFTEGLLHDRYDEYWQNDHRAGVMEALRVPVLLVGGWYDYYCYGMCRMWEKLSPAIRAASCFLMGPWGHDLRVRPDSDYPLPNGDPPRDYEAVWFESVRTGRPFPYGTVGKFCYYRIGSSRWLTAESPYQQAPSSLRLAFSADGRLTEGEPVPGEKTFRYDPEAPKHHDKHDYMFLCDPAPRGEDVLSFVSEPFAGEAAFFGPVRFRLTVRSDCEDTAFFLRLYLVEAGKAYNLVDGASTLRHAGPYAKGEVVTLTIETQPTAFTVKSGCGLRVDIASHSDCFVPHANTAEPFALAEKTAVAENTVFCGASEVILPGVGPGFPEGAD